jgi:CelD/BcsL family acetyltransferase involved in cellulose biosynthesis
MTAASPSTLASSVDSTLEALDPHAWDRLVAAMPHPTPFLLHGWIASWWRHYADGRELAVHTLRTGDRLHAALPLMVEATSLGPTVARFVGAPDSTLADIVAPSGADRAGLRGLVDGAVDRHRLADLFSLSPDGHLASMLPAACLTTRSHAPVMDLRDGWDETFARKASRRRRALYRRRWRQLRAAGPVELVVATEPGDVRSALEDAFHLHALRWRGRRDVSMFGDKRGRAFHREALAAVARAGAVRLVVLRVSGVPVAFTCSLHAGGRMFLHRLAFDPAYGRLSPGILVTLEAIRLAAEDGATHVEFLRGTERYKMELCDRVDVLSEAVLARGGFAHVAGAVLTGSTRAARSMAAGRRSGRALVSACKRWRGQ